MTFFKFCFPLFFWICLFFSLKVEGKISHQFQKKIDNSLKLGQQYLYLELKNSGLVTSDSYTPKNGHFASFPQGILALHLYSLLKTGADPKDPLIQKAFQKMYTYQLQKTYSVSLAILALYAKKMAEKKHKYKNKHRSHLRKGKLSFKEKNFLKKAVIWLLQTSNNNGLLGWSYGYKIERTSRRGSRAFRGGGFGDHSNSQFALLGLWAGHRMGVKVQKKYWKNILSMYLLSSATVLGDSYPVKWPSFSKKGSGFSGRSRSTRARKKNFRGGRTYKTKRGWSYSINASTIKRSGRARKGGGGLENCSAEMTIAGICGLLISGEMYGVATNRKVKATIGEGLCYVATHLDQIFKKSGSLSLNGYYLYSLERLGAFSKMEILGGVEWYKEYATKVMKAQRFDGSFGGMTQSCLTLLFLSRATKQFLTPKRVITGSGIHKKPHPYSPPKKQKEPQAPTVEVHQLPLPLAKKSSLTGKSPPKREAPEKMVANGSPSFQDLQGMPYIKESFRRLRTDQPFSSMNEIIFYAEWDHLIKDQKFSFIGPLCFLLLEGRKDSLKQMAHFCLVKLFGMDVGMGPEEWLLLYKQWKYIQSKKISLPKIRKLVVNSEIKGLLLKESLHILEEKKDLASVGILIQSLEKRRGTEEIFIILGTLQNLTKQKLPLELKKFEEKIKFFTKWWTKNNKSILLNQIIKKAISNLNHKDPKLQKRAYQILVAIGKLALPKLKKNPSKNPKILDLIQEISHHSP